MRQDLNKLLCERERSGSSRKFKYVRRKKAFNGENNRAYEGMKLRHNEKQFSENLNPLRGAIRKAVGKRWDTFYSELCEVFNMRSVINQHILQHLESEIVIDTYVEDGVIYERDKYGNTTPVSMSYSDYIVDPRDGIIKKNKWAAQRKEREQSKMDAKARLEAAKVCWIDGDNVLRLVDDVWFHFTMADAPVVRYEYHKPANIDLFNTSYAKRPSFKTWEKLHEYEKQKFGRRVRIGHPVHDVFDGSYVESSDIRTQRYHVTKQTASHKTLKQHKLAT